MSLAYHQPPREDWPTPSELADDATQPPPRPLPPEERAALVAELAAGQSAVHVYAGCPDCGVHCEICGERMCSMYGPEPAATCGAHVECVDCHADNRCRECRRVADEAVET